MKALTEFLVEGAAVCPAPPRAPPGRDPPPAGEGENRCGPASFPDRNPPPLGHFQGMVERLPGFRYLPIRATLSDPRDIRKRATIGRVQHAIHHQPLSDRRLVLRRLLHRRRLGGCGGAGRAHLVRGLSARAKSLRPRRRGDEDVVSPDQRTAAPGRSVRRGSRPRSHGLPCIGVI
jgi:hypothetical protein